MVCSSVGWFGLVWFGWRVWQVMFTVAGTIYTTNMIMFVVVWLENRVLCMAVFIRLPESLVLPTGR